VRSGRDTVYNRKADVRTDEQAHDDAESSPLLNGDAHDPDKVFTNTLDTELERVVSFYELKENEIHAELNALLQDEESFEEHQDRYNEEKENAPHGRKMRSGSVFNAIGFRPRAISRASGRSTDHGADGDKGSSDKRIDETSRLRNKSPDGQRRRQRATNKDTVASHASKRKTSVAFEDYNDMAFSALYNKGVSLTKRPAIRTAILYIAQQNVIQEGAEDVHENLGPKA
jgi:phosphate transporter